MYPGTIVNWHDQSQIGQSATITSIENRPMFMVVSSFDKGPEDLIEVEAEQFAYLYGKMSFEKHGQNSIQAQNIINAGGKLLVKRVCAKDSTIANVVLCAKLTTTETQKVDAEGNLIYLDDAGEETTAETSNPVMISSTAIKWEATSIENCKSFDEVKKAAINLLDDAAGVYPLIMYVDNGRGASVKAVKLTPDYSTSKGVGKMFYSLNIFEGTTMIENSTISFDPSIIYNDESYRFDKTSCDQIDGEIIESVYEAYINKLADVINMDAEYLRKQDLIFGYSNKGSVLSGLTLDAESVDLNSVYGIELKSGSNGEFGDKPVNTEAWTKAICAVYDGQVTDEVYDVDTHKVAAIVDANLPLMVKESIAKFVNFRQDCIFFRDFGTGLTTFMEIDSANNDTVTKSKFIADYATSYQIKDPTTLKNIEVTMMYDLAACLVGHIKNNPNAPVAGLINGFVLPSAIKGTINYTPVITPTVNQKQAMEDIRVNYAIFEGDNCIVQTCYTSQEENTQLSYINNVLAIQEVIRAVRTACPKQRYQLVDNGNLASYARAVNNVLANFRSNFEVLEFDYTQDRLKASQKIFYASIRFAFLNWAQTEIFDIYAIQNNY